MLSSCMMDELPPRRFPPGFTEEDFEFNKLYKCIQEEGCKVIRKLFRTLYSQPCMKTENGEMTLRKHLQKNCGKTNKYIKEKYKRYGLMDSNLMEDSTLMEENFDISFGCIIIEEICIFDDELKFISKELWEEVKWLKFNRNKVSHEYCYDKENLNSLCHHLKQIYILLKNKYGDSCKTEIDGMEAFIEKSKQFEVRQCDKESYIQDVRKIRDDNIYSMKEGRNEILKRDLKGTYFIDSYLESLNPCTFFVDDRIKHLNIREHFVIPKILNNRINYELNDMFSTSDVTCKTIPKVICMKGHNNSGKTSLCKYLLHSWATNKRTVIKRTSFDYVIYINVLSLKSNTLITAFKNELLPKTTKKFKDEHIIPTLQDFSILFLIDGYELRNCQTNPVIEEIFSKFGEQSTKSRIFVTTTPDEVYAIEQLARANQISFFSLEIEGFDKSQVKELSEKVFTMLGLEKEENSRLFESHIKNLSIGQDYLKLPGVIILILILWIEDNGTSPGSNSITSLYQKFFNLCQRKLKLYLKTSLNLDVEMKNCIKVFHMIGESYLSSLKQGTLLNFKDILSGIENIPSMKGNAQNIVLKLFDTADDGHLLLNKTQMQYLGALYLFSRVNDSDVEEMLQGYDVHNLSSIIIFFVGIAHMHGQFDPPLASTTFATIQKELLVTGKDFEFWWALISECPNIERYGYDIDICGIVASVLEREWNLNEDNIVKAIKLLMFTPVKPRSITISISLTVDPLSIPGLVELFLDMKLNCTSIADIQTWVEARLQ